MTTKTTDDLRTRILDAAERVIRARGVGAATTREIARVAGCSEGSLYNHFPDKGELLFSVFTERLPAFISLLRDLPSRAGSRTVRFHLEELAETALEFFGSVVPMTASVLADPELRGKHQQRLKEQDVGPHMAYRLLTEYLRAEQAIGRVDRRAKVEAVPPLILGACYHLAVLSHLTGDEVDANERFLKDIVRTLVTGIAPKE